MDVTSATSAQSLSGTQATSLNKLTQTYDDFLKLLTTQMQYQDPLNPLDSKEFTNQLVAFSEVEQSIRSNQTLADIKSALASTGAQTALGYIGLDVTYSGNGFNYTGGDQAIGYTLPANAKESAITIRDAGGSVVFTAAGEKSAGSHSFTWNGKLADGSTAKPGIYSVSVGALDAEGATLKTTTSLTGNVSGIETREDGLYLNFGNLAVPQGNVSAARKPIVIPAATAA